MKTLTTLPPNYLALRETFPALATMPDVLFVYDGVLYNPSGKFVPLWKLAHEEVHAAQQRLIGAAIWWSCYMNDPAFRLEQEIPAYRIDYQQFCEQYKDRNERTRYVDSLARDLSGPLYGSCLNYQTAKQIILA